MNDNTFSKDVKVSGGKLPSGYEVRFKVTLDYAGVSREELIKRASSKDIITLQNQWRNLPTKVLNGYADTGLKVDAKDIGTRTGGGISYKATLMAMGLSEEEATKILNNPEKLAQVEAMLKTI